MQKSHSIVPVTPQKPLRGRVLFDDRDYVSVGDLQDISKLYITASKSEGKQFFIASSKYIGFLLTSNPFKKTITELMGEKPTSWQKLVTMRSIWGAVETEAHISKNMLIIEQDVYVEMQKIARGEVTASVERFIRRYKANLLLVHNQILDVTGGTRFLASMEALNRTIIEQAKLFANLMQPVIENILRAQKDFAEIHERVASSMNVMVAFTASLQTQISSITKFAEDVNRSLVAVKPYFDSIEQVSKMSRFAFSFQASIVSSPRDSLQLAIYNEARETKEYQKRQTLLLEVQFRINNPQITDEHIVALYTGSISPAYLANALRPALPQGSSFQSYTKATVDELIDRLRLYGKEKKLVECLANAKGHFVKANDIRKEVDTEALSRMVSTVNKKLNKASWKIEREGNSYSYFRYRLVKLRVEQHLLN